MRSLIVSSNTISGDKIHITDNEDISYLSVVLRMKQDDKLLVSDGSGRVWETRIDSISRGGIELSVISKRYMPENDMTRVTLYQGLPKGAKMEEIVRKATELDVFKIVPLETCRTIPRSGDISASKFERWRRIAKEASRQSGRLLVPEVNGVIRFEEAAAELAGAGYDLILVLFELEENRTLKQALRDFCSRMPNNSEKPYNIAIFIGPEGGFEKTEIEDLVSEGAESVTIGDTILRTETAGPAAITMILYEFDM